MSFTIDVLSRLSRAGVDPITFEVGRVVCRDLTLGPLAQKPVYEALSTLQSFSSYGKVIWFGFGVRNVVHDLASTEQGMTCVAICAALRVSYHTSAAAVLRELSQRFGAPDGLLPALHQWEALLRVCTGALSASKFPRLVDGFSRIVAPSRLGQPIPHFAPTTPVALTQALCLVSDATRGCVASCTFVGGIDCAWLAAVAEWLYGLCVEIRSGDSWEVLYRTSAEVSDSADAPHVTILRSEDSSQPASALSKTFVLPRGTELIFRRRSLFSAARACPQPFQRRSDWSHILTDSFGDAVGSLLKGSTGESFAYLLGYVGEGGRRLRTDPSISESRRGYWPTISFVPDSGCETFFEFAGRCLPELKACLKSPRVRRDKRTYSESEVCASISTIKSACICLSCTARYPPPYDYCLQTLAFTIIHTLRLLHRVEIHHDILPSTFGLRRIYEKAKDEFPIRFSSETLPVGP